MGPACLSRGVGHSKHMLLRRRIWGVLILGVLISGVAFFASRRSTTLTIYLPNGGTTTCVEAQLPDVEWERFAPGDAQTAEEKFMPSRQKFTGHVDFHVRQSFGKLRFSSPAVSGGMKVEESKRFEIPFSSGVFSSTTSH